ncbi:MAG TPA: YibE/F family protein [Acidimicrobiales bacterium]|nr:YibE/F family protein [Acidimicrobiales bacterium]
MSQPPDAAGPDGPAAVPHAHAHGLAEHDLDVDPHTRRLLSRVAVVLAVATALGAILLWPRESPSERLTLTGLTGTFYDAAILEIDVDRPCAGPGLADEEPLFGDDQGGAALTCPVAELEVLQGPDRGSRLQLDLPGGLQNAGFEAGDKVVLSYTEQAQPGFEYAFADRQRKPVLFWFAVAFALVVLALGRLRGLAALLGLGASLVVLLSFILPAILDGRSPVSVALVGSAAIAFLALYLAHGPGPATTVALLGTLCSLALTAVLALAAVSLAGLTGFASEEAMIVQLAESRIDLSGLVLAGVVIGALGAVDDMTVTQVAAVSELHRANPTMGRLPLYAAALRIGRDHVASTVNTLALAYAGASIPVLLLFLLSRQSLGTVANGEVMATEIIRTLAGSIGLVSSVPITTWLAVRVIPTGPAGAAASAPAAPRWRKRAGKAADTADAWPGDDE